MPHQRRLAHARIRQADAAGAQRRRLGGAQALRRLGAAGDLAVGLLGERPHLARLDVAGDDHDRVVGRVVAVVPGHGVVEGEAGHLVRPADDRNAVMAVPEERGADRLAELGAGIVVDARAPLLEDDLALRQQRLVGEDEVRHPVGLVLHHQAEMLLGDGLDGRRCSRPW